MRSSSSSRLVRSPSMEHFSGVKVMLTLRSGSFSLGGPPPAAAAAAGFSAESGGCGSKERSATLRSTVRAEGVRL